MFDLREYKPWEVSSFSGLRSYLFENCITLYAPFVVKDEEGREIAEDTKYDFDKDLRVKTRFSIDGMLTIIVSGENSLLVAELLDTLNEIISNGVE